MTLSVPARSIRSRPAGRATHPGFTLVEMLVVIAVIAALIGILMVGLQSAQRSGKRTKQMSDLRQVFNAWSQYAGTYNDSLLSGYMDDGVQASWRVSFKHKDGTRIPVEHCRTYPWRLLPYLDGSFPTLYDYLEFDDNDVLNPKNPDGSLNETGMSIVASQPAFGYNAYYLGGWWTTQGGNPSLAFGNGTWTETSGNTARGRIVATKLGGISVPDRMIAFCASSYRSAGFYKMERDDAVPGAAWVVPARLAEELVWRPSDGTSFGAVQLSANTFGARPGDDIFDQTVDIARFTLGQVTFANAGTGVEVLIDQAVPQRRFGSSVAVVHADGSTVPLGIGELLDQRRWMNPANGAQGAPTEFQHTPD